jgi:thiol-disulfide isomerase/thioredoxin
MKAFTVLLFALLCAPLFAAPDRADAALVDKYKDFNFSVAHRIPQQVYGGVRVFELDGGLTLWVANDGTTVVHTPEKVRIEIISADGAERERRFELPSGRTCTIGADRLVDWGVVKEEAPGFDLALLGSGKRVRLSDLRGHVVLLDFWASWCPPCIDALAESEALNEAYGRRGLVVLGICIEGNAAKARAAVEKLGVKFPTAMAEGDDTGRFDFESRQVKQYHVRAIPAAFLVDRAGIVRKAGLPTPTEIEALLPR